MDWQNLSHYTKHNLVQFFCEGCAKFEQTWLYRFRGLQNKLPKVVKDMNLHLTAKSLWATIEAETNISIGEAEKATTMIFIQRYMHDALQTEYHVEEDSWALWVALVDCFDPQRDIFLPETRYGW